MVMMLNVLIYTLNYNTPRSGRGIPKELRKVLIYIRASQRDIRKKRQRIKLKYK